MSIIYLKNNSLHTDVVDDEFDVSYEISNGIILTGKVDLVCYNYSKKEVKFIELKTGKPYSTEHNRQLRLYGEIFNKNYSNSGLILNLELWNSKSGDPKDGFSKIKPLQKYEKKEIDVLNTKLQKYLKCDSENQLPSKLNFIGSEKICNNCSFCTNVVQLFPDLVSKKTSYPKKGLDRYFQ